MAVTGSLTDPNYTVVSTNTGSWTVNAVGVTPLRGPVTDGSPRYIPAPSGRPSELDSGALSGLGNWSAAVNIGLANSIAAGPVAAARLPARDAGTPTVSPSPMPSRSPMPISIPPSLDMPLAIPPPEPLPVLAATTPPVANTDCPDNSRSQVPNCDVASPPKQVPAPIGFMASPPDHDALLADMNRKPEGLAGFTIVPRVVVTAAAATAGLTIVTGLMLKLLGDSTAINGLLSVMLVWRLFKRLIAMIRRKWRGNKDRPPSVPPSDANRAPEAAGASKISGGHNVIASAVF